MRGITLPGNTTPLDYFKRLLWDETMAQDRFFGYADPQFVTAVRAAAAAGHFAEEEDCASFHPGATCSYKQTDYDVANVQLTFHEKRHSSDQQREVYQGRAGHRLLQGSTRAWSWRSGAEHHSSPAHKPARRLRIALQCRRWRFSAWIFGQLSVVPYRRAPLVQSRRAIAIVERRSPSLATAVERTWRHRQKGRRLYRARPGSVGGVVPSHHG